jgi:hypothetical protein
VAYLCGRLKFLTVLWLLLIHFNLSTSTLIIWDSRTSSQSLNPKMRWRMSVKTGNQTTYHWITRRTGWPETGKIKFQDYLLAVHK